MHEQTKHKKKIIGFWPVLLLMHTWINAPLVIRSGLGSFLRPHQ